MAKTPEGYGGAELLLRVGEELKRQSAKPNINGYVPHAKQVNFHSSPAKTRLYVGGNRSGKSFGNVAECVYWLRKNHPYRRIPVGDYEETRGRISTVDFINGVDKILLPLFKQLMPPSLLVNGSWDDSYHRASRVLTCSNGSFIEFLSYESDLDKFAGTSRHFVCYDEEPPEVIYTENKARLIDTGGHQWFSMTPVEGMSWVYDTIYLPGKSGREGFHVTEISMEENPYLGRQEVKDFLEDLDDNERKARGQGRFVEMGGLIYKNFDPFPGGLHVLDNLSFKFPKNVPIGLSLDHGFNNPTAVLWHAILPEGKIITFHEHYLSGEVIQYHAKAIHQFNREHRIAPSLWVADPSIKNVDPITGTSILQEYAKYGCPWTLGNNDVKAGIERVSGFLKDRGAGNTNWKCTKDCTNLIREMARYKWQTYTSKKLNARYNNMETPHKLNDHTCDSLRYFMMSRPNLESEFDYANPVSDPTEFYDDSVSQHTGDWTVKQIRGAEYEQYMAMNSEYADHSGMDNLGGLW